MSLTRFERAVLRDLPALIRKNDSLVDAIIARLRGLGNGGRGPQSDGRGLITGQFGPFTDEFDDGALESMWTWLSTPQSYSEGDGTLSVDFSDHQGDHLPLGTWEFLYQEGDFDTFDIGVKYNASAFTGTDHSKAGVAVEDANGTRYSHDLGDEGATLGYEFSTTGGSVNLIDTDSGGFTDDVWLRLRYDGSVLYAYYEQQSDGTFGNWSLNKSTSTSLSTPIKLGLHGNIDQFDFNFFGLPK